MTPPERDVVAARLRARTRLFAVLLGGSSMLSLFLPLPWRLVGLPFALATAVVGVGLLAALGRWRRAGGRAGGVVGIGVGLGVAGVLVVLGAVQLPFYSQLSDWERCNAQASTLQAKQRCDERFRSELPGGAPRAVRPVSPAAG